MEKFAREGGERARAPSLLGYLGVRTSSWSLQWYHKAVARRRALAYVALGSCGPALYDFEEGSRVSRKRKGDFKRKGSARDHSPKLNRLGVLLSVLLSYLGSLIYCNILNFKWHLYLYDSLDTGYQVIT